MRRPYKTKADFWRWLWGKMIGLLQAPVLALGGPLHVQKDLASAFSERNKERERERERWLWLKNR